MKSVQEPMNVDLDIMLVQQLTRHISFISSSMLIAQNNKLAMVLLITTFGNFEGQLRPL